MIEADSKAIWNLPFFCALTRINTFFKGRCHLNQEVAFIYFD